MARGDQDYADRYAFYFAYDGCCAYCNRSLRYEDMQIDHIIPQHLAKHPEKWQKAVADCALESNFAVDWDENRMASCGADNCHKGGTLFPVLQAVIFLRKAAEKAPLVKKYRNKTLTERKLGRILADVDKAVNQNPSFREELSALLEPNFGSIHKSVGPWKDDTEAVLVRGLFGGASAALLAWPQEIGGHWLVRPELSQLESALSDPATRLVALLGKPGSGKSAILARLGNKFRSEGRILLAIKADQLPTTVGSLCELDEWLQITESLPILIERLAGESSVTVFIDQLDALSDLMDTHTERLSAILALIDRAAQIPNVRLIVSCREFDADHDLRVRGLVDRSGTIRITLADPSWEEVSSFLKTRGFEPEGWPDSAKTVLSRPQHLKLFLKHFEAQGARPTFENYQAMLEQILQDRVITPFGVKAADALDAITAEMAVTEELWLPRARFERIFHDELIQLREAGLIDISTDQLTIGFAHQTVFDFLRARALVAGGRSLFADVKARQDGLTLRPELLSSITYLRNASLGTYRAEMFSLLSSPAIRAHVQILLIEFLGDVSNPSLDEATWLRPLFRNSELRPHIFRAIAGKKEWYTLLRSAVATAAEIDPLAAYQACWVLGPALSFDRFFVMQSLINWSTKKEFDLASFQLLLELDDWDEQAYDVLDKVIRRTTFHESWICRVAKRISTTRPDLAARTVRVKLDQTLSQAREQCAPWNPPVEATQDELIEYGLRNERLAPIKDLLRRNNEWYELDEVASNGPGDFIEGIWTWVDSTSAELSDRSQSNRSTRYRDEYSWRLGEEHGSYLAEAIWSAVTTFASAQPDRFLDWAGRAGKSEQLSIHRLIVHGLSALATERPAEVVDYLLSDERRLSVGSYLAGFDLTEDLIKAVGPGLTDGDFDKLVIAIERWNPHVANSAESIKWNRESQLRLLGSLPPTRLSKENKSELAQAPARASRKRGRETVLGAVRSPISAANMGAMSDSDILALLEEYPDNRESDYRVRGCFEVAAEFGEFAKMFAKRAVGLLRRLRPGINELAAGQGLDAISNADAVSREEGIALAHELFDAGFRSEEFRSRFCYALVNLAQKGGGLADESITRLRSILQEPEMREDPSVELRDSTPSTQDRKRRAILWEPIGGALPHGNYPVLLAITIGLLRRTPANHDEWLTILEGHLAMTEDSEVWLGLLHYLRWLNGANRDRAVDFVRRLLLRYPKLLATGEGIRFIAYCHDWLTQALFDDVLERIENSGWSEAQRAIGELLLLRRALVPTDAKCEARVTDLRDSFSPVTDDIHLGLLQSACETWSNPRIREVSHTILIAAIPNAKDLVAQLIMGTFDLDHHGRLAHDELTSELLAAVSANPDLLKSPNTTSLVNRLKELLEDGYSPIEIGRIARRIVDIAGYEIADMSKSLASSADDLIDISITLQRFREARLDGTWIFEKLLIANPYPMKKTVAALDRRF